LNRFEKIIGIHSNICSILCEQKDSQNDNPLPLSHIPCSSFMIWEEKGIQQLSQKKFDMEKTTSSYGNSIWKNDGPLFDAPDIKMFSFCLTRLLSNYTFF